MQVSSWKASMQRLCARKAEPRVDVDDSPATSWAWTTSAPFSTLATSWSVVPSFSFWQPIFSTYHPLYTSHIFPDLFFISALNFLFLSLSLVKKSFEIAFSRRNFQFCTFVKPEYSPFLGRPERIKVWIFSSLINFLAYSYQITHKWLDYSRFFV